MIRIIIQFDCSFSFSSSFFNS
uniref:Uncharacterized protein n=1 Tax=Tetranychus urticae TaxID=32264 RepID=T1KS17_TETUR